MSAIGGSPLAKLINGEPTIGDMPIPDPTTGDAPLTDPTTGQVYGLQGWSYPVEQVTRPGFVAPYNPATDAFLPYVQQLMQGTNLDTSGLQKYAGEAMREGPSAWAGLMTQRNNAETNQAHDQAVQQTAGATAAGEAGLAMHGGLSNGARERMQTAGGNNLVNAEQGVTRQGNLNNMQVGINDEQNRVSQLGQLPGMENQVYQDAMQKNQLLGQAKQDDIQNQMMNQEQQNEFNINLYHEQMQQKGASQTANATLHSGKKG